jgi:hypothetical protein
MAKQKLEESKVKIAKLALVLVHHTKLGDMFNDILHAPNHDYRLEGNQKEVLREFLEAIKNYEFWESKV